MNCDSADVTKLRHGTRAPTAKKFDNGLKLTTW